MNYNNPQAKRATRIVHAVCDLLFCLFSFFYLWKVHGGVIGMAQHVLSQGLTVYFPPVGAAIITFVLLLLQWVLNRIFRLRREWYMVSYFPSFLCLALITSVDATVYEGMHLGYWKWLFPLGIAVFLCVAPLFKHIYRLYNLRDGALEPRMLIPNLILFMVWATGCLLLSDTDEATHNHFAMEYMMSKGEYDAALEVGHKSNATSPEITALRCYALARNGQLGERLFNYPQQYGADGLLLNLQDTARMIFSPMQLYRELGACPRYHREPAVEFLELLDLSPKAKQPMAEQYLLCAYLLDRKLDRFVDKLAEVYQLNDSVVELPRYYAEALVLYQRTHPGRFTYRNEIQETNYQDYRKIVLTAKNSLVARNKTRRDFGTTYWWYYDAVNPTEK